MHAYRRDVARFLVTVFLLTASSLAPTSFAHAAPTATQSPTISLDIIAKLADILRGFQTYLSQQSAPSPIPQQVAAAGSGGFAVANRIDTLSNTEINTPTITGGSISGANISGIIGGALSGTASFTEATSSILSAGKLSLSNTTGTTTIASGQGFTIGDSQLVVQQGSANVGIGTANPAAKLDISGALKLTDTTGTINYALATFTGASGRFVSIIDNDGSGRASVITTSVHGSTGATGTLTLRSTDGNSNYAGITIGTADLSFLTTSASLGTTRLTIKGGSGSDSGNVGIGTTTPGALLSANGNILGAGTLALTGTSGTTTIAAGQGFAIGGSQFVVQQGSGNVGIGASSPGARLHSNVSSSNAQATALLLQNDAANTAGGVDIDFKSSDTVVGRISSITGAQSNFGQLAFYTKSSGSLTERMRIDMEGNVGIGTTSPTAKLEIAGGASAGTLILNSNALDGSLYFGGPTGANSTYIYGYRNAGSAGRMDFYTDNTLRFRILGDGKVAIGAISPASALDVSGGVSVGSYAGTNAAPSNGMIISGNVGIGTTAPTYKLTIAGTNTAGPGSSAQLAVGDGGDGNVGKMLQIGYNTTDDYGWMQPVHWGNGYKNLVLNQNGGNVGIGTTSPQSKLHIANGFSGAVPLSGTDLTVERSTGGYVSLLGPGTGDNGILFGNPTSNADGGIIYDPVSTPRGLQFRTGGNQTRLTINSSGNVGIGTTTPGAKLTISSGNSGASLGGNTSLFLDSSNSQYIQMAAASNAIVGFLFGRSGNHNIGGITYNNANDTMTFSANPGTTMNLTSTGLGIGTTTPTAQLSTTGTVRFSNFGAGTLTTDASGNLSVSSDERLKNIDGAFSRGLADIVQLNPINYHWSATSGLDTTTQYAGFSAQNVQAVIPEAVGSSTNGYLTLQDRPLIAAVVNAIKEIASITGTFRSTLITFLGDASNGITAIFARDIYATNGDFQHLASDDLCLKRQGGTLICITADQLAALLSQSAAAGFLTSVIPSAASGLPISVISHAPVLELNGNASSTIDIGDTYNDLGARIVAPTSDLNLGLTIILDGATTSAVSIDTDTPGEHTILYTVTSSTSGLTGRATRTVIVSPAGDAPEPANDNPFNAPPANDNASSTSVLIVEATASI